MIEISYKRYGELIQSAVRVSELEHKLARMAEAFELQTENVKYWKSTAENARNNAYNLVSVLGEKDKKITELESALEETINRLAAIIVTAFGAE